jgi:hypothetical protein
MKTNQPDWDFVLEKVKRRGSTLKSQSPWRDIKAIGSDLPSNKPGVKKTVCVKVSHR